MTKTNHLMTGTIYFLLVAILPLNIFAHDKEDIMQAQRIIEKSGITPLIVLGNVQKKYPNGVIYEYEMEKEDGIFVHEVELINLDEKRRYEITLDAQTGAIIEEDIDAIFWFGQDDDLQAAKYLSKSGFHLSKAIQKIELAKGVVIYRIEFEEKHGIHYIEIKTYGPHGEKEWLIDTDRQSIIPNFNRWSQ